MSKESHVQEYFNEKAVTFLKQAIEAMEDLHAIEYCQEVENLISYMRHHGSVAIKDLIKEVWD